MRVTALIIAAALALTVSANPKFNGKGGEHRHGPVAEAKFHGGEHRGFGPEAEASYHKQGANRDYGYSKRSADAEAEPAAEYHKQGANRDYGYSKRSADAEAEPVAEYHKQGANRDYGYSK